MIDPPKTLAEARKYRYGHPIKHAFREGYCAEEVQERGRAGTFYQCQRKAVTGPQNLFCKQHDPAAVAARAKASADKWDADMDRRSKASDINALRRAAQLLKATQPGAALACRELAEKMKNAE
ncbi:MAG TPA: hypothetical protein VGR95_12475 [Thermoanaerobaculia bacterium]|jgi:hypothetical protein|nr:hypothetical protein [Thermoanaerobaculia bacterium]